LAVKAERPEKTQPSGFFHCRKPDLRPTKASAGKGSALGNLYPFLKHHQQKTHRRLPPDGVKAAVDNLRQSYQAIGKPERFDTLFFNGPHKFPLQIQWKMMDGSITGFEDRK
jgi:hypothetical protein